MINVILHHYDDWTELTERYNIVVSNPYFMPIQGMGINFEVFRFNEGYNTLVKNFIDKIRLNGKTIVKVVRVIPHRKYTDVVMYGDYAKSVKSEFIRSMFMITKSEFKDGLEYYTAIAPVAIKSVKDSLTELKSRLQEKAGIVSLTYRQVDTMPINIWQDLTSKEAMVLKVAYEMGYFNYPRSVNLEDLAKELKLSKATVDYYLRSALRKLISNYARELSRTDEKSP